MEKQNKFIKLKVTTGYLLLTFVLLFSVWFVYHELEKLSKPDQYEQELSKKRKTTNNTLSQLYQMEVIGQSLSAGRLSDYPLYKKAMKEALVSIDSLKSFVTDSMQLLRIDSISLLLNRKERNMVSLLKVMSEANSDTLYQQNIEEIIAEQDSLLQQQRVQRKVTVRKNSYQVQKKPKGFFKRLADAFAPGKRDTTTITNTSREILTDTLVQEYNPADTISGILKNIQAQVNDKRQDLQNQLKGKANNLRYNGQVLSSKINQILHDFEEEEALRSFSKLEQGKSIRQQSMKVIGGIAIGSALLAFLLLALIWRDITKSNHYRKELEIAKKRAEDLLVAREKLMLTITHDIKAPVGSILGYIDLLSRLTKEERQLFYLNNMKSSSEHLLKLVNNLLDFHRLDSNKMEINRVAFNPSQLFNEIKTSFEPVAAKKDLQLDYRIDEKLNGSFISDPFRIRQITDNLISNALKFTQKGSVGLFISYKDSSLSILVTDTGSGMSEEEQRKIFEEFTRLRSAQGEEGFGLGLSITQKLVVLLEGNIRVNSTPGKGSSFEVQLPLFPVAGNNTPKAEARPDKENYESSQKFRLLLIDDDRIQLQLTSAMLGQQGIESVCCETPEALFEALKEQTFDVLLTDVQMPAINGFDLLELLRKSNIPQARTIPVVAVTARSDMHEQDFIRKGFTGCLHKPFTMSELHHFISSGFVSENKRFMPNEKPLPDVSELNFSALTAFSKDDKEAAAEIIRTFISETKKNCDTLQEALEKQDADSISRLAHKMLPLFRMIKAQACVVPLEVLERRKDGQFDAEIEERTKTALAETRKVIVLISSQQQAK